MSKNLRCLALATLATLWLTMVAAAQSDSASQAGKFDADLTTAPGQAAELPQPPPYCNPCVFYAGDFDPNLNSRPNGLFNENFRAQVDGAVWVPFQIAKSIVVQGLFVNQLFASPPPATAPAQWAISSGVSQGNGGLIQCQGSSIAKATRTGRQFTFGNKTYTEWTYLLKLTPSSYCNLSNTEAADSQEEGPPGRGGCPGKCHLSLVTNLSATGDALLTGNFGYLSDVEDINPPHHFGLPNVLDDSFFNSVFYGMHFVPAQVACRAGQSLSITTVGCDMFSVGIIGTGQ
jgi:hypothetical protein